MAKIDLRDLLSTLSNNKKVQVSIEDRVFNASPVVIICSIKLAGINIDDYQVDYIAQDYVLKIRSSKCKSN